MDRNFPGPRLLGLVVALASLTFLTRPATAETAPSSTSDWEAPAEPPTEDEAAHETALPPSNDAKLPSIGLSADAGLPDGMMASLVIRPVPALRLELGAGANTSAPGVRAGITCLPFGMGPSLTLEAGHYLDGDANGVVRSFFGGVGKFATSVNRLNYTFANAHLGLDFGTRNLTFFVHGGLTFIRATLTDVSPMETAASDGGGTATLSFPQNPVLRMWAPSAKVGLIFYLQ